jgi:calcineurin-like phosphoesterase family protein/ASPM-SPD-2-Hydin domain-containing protein
MKPRIGLVVTWTLLAVAVWSVPGAQLSKAATQPIRPAAADSFTFTVAGDHGGNDAATENLEHLGALGAAFHLAIGDLSYGSFPTEAGWCDFVKSHVGSTFPFEIVAGDHEDNGPDGDIRNFAKCLPDRIGNVVGEYGRQYWFDYPPSNPLVRSILVSPGLLFPDGSISYKKGSEAYEWTAAAIDDARAKGIPWVVVGAHKQCLSVARLSGCEVGSDLLNMLVDKRVDLLFMGHDHSYQRGKQLAHGTGCATVPVSSFDASCVVGTGSGGTYTKGAGMVPMVVASFGDALFAIDQSRPTAGYWARWMGNNTDSTHGFGKADVTRDRIDFQFVGADDGQFTDSFSIVAAPGLAANPPSVAFGAQQTGTAAAGRPVTVTNNSPSPVAVGAVTVEAAHPADFALRSNTCTGTTLAPGGACTISAGFTPSVAGTQAATIVVQNGSPAGPLRIAVTGSGTTSPPPPGGGGTSPGGGEIVPGSGYWLAASDGGIFAFGNAAFHGSTGAIKLAQPIVAMASTPSGNGYWLVAADGGIFAFGDARFQGSTGGLKLAQPIVTMASTPSGNGYWLVAADGGIFAFGDARFQGSTGAIKLSQPIVGMASTPSGNGYWLVAADGGIFAFGDARFQGSTGAIKLAKPIVGMASTPSGNGYWLAASDGGIFAFGDATFHGSTGALKLAKPIIGMTATPSGGGYLLIASDGGIFAFGDATFQGSTGSTKLNKPIVAAAAHR